MYLCAIPPLPSTRQRPSYGDCLEVQREYYQNCSVLDCVTQCSHQQHTYVSSSYRSNRLGLSLWDPYAMRRGGCLELCYCNMVEWFWWDSSLIFDDQLVSVKSFIRFTRRTTLNYSNTTKNILFIDVSASRRKPSSGLTSSAGRQYVKACPIRGLVGRTPR